MLLNLQGVNWLNSWGRSGIRSGERRWRNEIILRAGHLLIVLKGVETRIWKVRNRLKVRLSFHFQFHFPPNMRAQWIGSRTYSNTSSVNVFIQRQWVLSRGTGIKRICWAERLQTCNWNTGCRGKRLKWRSKLLRWIATQPSNAKFFFL